MASKNNFLTFVLLLVALFSFNSAYCMDPPLREAHQSIKLTSTSHHMPYGLTRPGSEDIWSITMEAVSQFHKNPVRPRFIFVLDKSSSMRGDPLIIVKAGLLAMRDEWGGRDVISDDKFKNAADWVIVSFDKNSYLEWSSFDGEFYNIPVRNAINTITVGNGTNLEAGCNKGLEIQKSLAKHNILFDAQPTWVIVLTDGDSYYGERKPAGMQKIYNKFHDGWTSVFTVGIGPYANTSLLVGADAMGYGSTAQQFVEALGTITYESRNIVAVDAKIIYEFNGSDEKEVIAIGTLFTGRKFLSTKSLTGREKRAIFQYTDLDTGKVVSIPLEINKSEDKLSPEALKLYFDRQSAANIQKLYSLSYQDAEMQTYRKNLEAELTRWHQLEAPEAAEAIASVTSALEKVANRRVNKTDKHVSTTNFQNQSTQRVTGGDKFSTPAVIATRQRVTEVSGFYVGKQ